MKCMRLMTAIAVMGAVVSATVGSARASTIHMASGLSGTGNPISMQATLTIVGDTLTIKLENNSPIASLSPNDILGSYYFDIVDGANMRPVLTYQSAIGDVYLTSRTQPDSLQTANANLAAFIPGDNTWQYKGMNPVLASFLGFGIGTVGNSNLSPNGFNGNIVGGMDYCIYRGEVTTQNLDGRLLVKDMATFTFTGVSGFSEADISQNFAFGLGTAPDSLLIPEPVSAALWAAGFLMLSRRKPPLRLRRTVE